MANKDQRPSTKQCLSLKLIIHLTTAAHEGFLHNILQPKQIAELAQDWDCLCSR